MSRLLELDRSLFYTINHGWASPFLDRLLPWLTHVGNFWPLFYLAALWLAISGGRRGRIFLAALAVALLISDPLTVRVLKPLVARLRPCVELDDVRLLISRRTSYSFPSAHAVNVSAAVVVLWSHYRRAAVVALPIFALVALSRVYIGVHYPFDLIAGACLGVAIGLGVIALFRWAGGHVSWFAPSSPRGSPDSSRIEA